MEAALGACTAELEDQQRQQIADLGRRHSDNLARAVESQPMQPMQAFRTESVVWPVTVEPAFACGLTGGVVPAVDCLINKNPR